MEIEAGQLDWIATDEQALANFLDTPTGRRFIPKLLEQAPTPLESGETNAVLIRSGKVLGYSEVVKLILALSHSPPKLVSNPTHDNYPPLEKDTAWDKPKDEPALLYQEPPPPQQPAPASVGAATEQ